MDNLLKVLEQLPASMAEALKFSLRCDYEVGFGNIEAIKLSVKLQVLSKACLMACEKIEPHVLTEAEKYHKDELREKFGGVIKEVGTKFAFDRCNDSIYDQILIDKKAISDKEKARVKFLKAIGNSEVVNPDTGEMMHSPSRESTTKVVFTLK